jgi:hypothetical protein
LVKLWQENDERNTFGFSILTGILPVFELPKLAWNFSVLKRIYFVFVILKFADLF